METNPRLELAFHFIRYTGVNLFLTGKAGTGKTTFLRTLKEISPKRMIVVAPTGVAAIHAGGVTIHSFFQLPFGPYLPGSADQEPAGGRRMKFGKEKINILRSLDLLVIDEISMVRADMLDAVSDVLRRYKDRSKPFGGVQLLLIGDLQQLAPVIKEDEWELLRAHYPSAYFFESKALKESAYQCIELTQVFRQADPVFIDLLNRIRENRIDEATLAELNRRYIPGFRPADNEGYITLTTHNYQAQQINASRLAELPGPGVRFAARIDGEFPSYAFPTDESLELKTGAQVMFVKNDSSGNHRYFNGKIGLVSELTPGRVAVRCPGDQEPVVVEPEEWTNVKYTLNEETKEITETVEGTFSQYPLKTAWAITIHKSQGLTFEKAIVEAAASFSHGQVYVALSRCKTLEGLVLRSPIRFDSVISDTTVRDFTHYVERHQPDRDRLQQARKLYYLSLLEELFDYEGVERRLRYVSRLFYENLQSLYPQLTERYGSAVGVCRTQLTEVGRRFREQLRQLAAASADCEADPFIGERVAKGVAYFKEKTAVVLWELLEATQPEIDNKEVRKTVEKALDYLRQDVEIKAVTLAAAEGGFDIGAYLSARARAMIGQPKQKQKKTTARTPAAPKKTDISGDILHPVLYESLRSWRHGEAAAQGVPVYVVLQQKALLGVVNTLPADGKDLLAIPGIGKKVVEKYGAVLLDLVDAYRYGATGEGE